MFNFEDVKEINPIAPAPKVSGCMLSGVGRNDPDKSMSFNFMQKTTGAVLAHREFKPSRMEGQSDEDYKKNITLAVGRIAHIYRAFATEEQFKAVKVSDPNNLSKAGENWMEITAIVGKSLKEMITAGKDMTCDLKVVYREQKKDGKTNYYSSLPAVPPFISTVSHPKDFTINPQYDKFTIPVVGASYDQELPPAGQTGGASTGAGQSAFAGTTAPPASGTDF